MTWIKVEDELPEQRVSVLVKNGRKIYDAYYSRKKWRRFGKQLHKVTEWKKDPVLYPKVPRKDLNAFLRRAKKYRHQMQKKEMRFNPQP